MKLNLYGGKFVVFEGLDGSGQSTQAKLLKEYFDQQGIAAFLTKEPTQWTVAGKKIKEVLGEEKKLEPLQLQELFVRDRSQHLKKEIVPALKAGKIVICDRYFFSTLAFGGIDVPISELMAMNDMFLYPDKTFFLKVRPEVCLQRIEKREEGVKFFEKLEKLRKVAANYQKIFQDAPNAVILNGEKSILEIHKKIINNLNF